MRSITRFKTLITMALLFLSPLCFSKEVLVVLSGESDFVLKNGKVHKTGFFLNELMIPVLEMQKDGIKLTFATPKGGVAFLDKGSDNGSYFENKKEYKAAVTALNKLGITKNKKRILSFGAVIKDGLSHYSGLFIPGGHAPMIDLYNNKKLGKILEYFHKTQKPTASVCHGPVAFLSASTKKGWVYKGYKMTVFSNDEERVVEKTKLKGSVPFDPEDTLREHGAKVLVKPKWHEHVVVDRELITGQNPQSERKMIEVFIKKLNAKH